MAARVRAATPRGDERRPPGARTLPGCETADAGHEARAVIGGVSLACGDIATAGHVALDGEGEGEGDVMVPYGQAFALTGTES